MLLHLDGEVIEIRPSEYFESKSFVDSRYLEIVETPVEKKKKGRPSSKSIKENLNGSST
jgi:hypothetical protein